LETSIDPFYGIYFAKYILFNFRKSQLAPANKQTLKSLHFIRILQIILSNQNYFLLKLLSDLKM